MQKIHKLSLETISQIAAGEVVERPSTVVKELIENSLDAGANDIVVNIENAGLTKIEVIDDGIGMSKEDLSLCAQPHTTSKLNEITDLNYINTLGFRGEALNSIASASDLTIKSKLKNSNIGYKLTFSGKSTPKISSIGMKSGTSITVSNLFKNVPARKKFLKSAQTETRLILEIVSDFCLSHPNVNFKLVINKKVVLNEIKSKVKDRLTSLWGEAIATNMLTLKHSANFFKINGFLGKPQIASHASNKLLIYVNKRRVSDKLILTSIKDAYGTLLMTRSFPTGVVFIDMPPHLVDINVHPTKREVRFSGQNEVFNEISLAVKELLQKNNLTYQNVNFLDGGNIRSDLREIISDKEIAHLGEVSNKQIFQLHQSYLLYETKEGVQIIDQHAAHEALLYFEFLDEYNKKQKISLDLKSPVVISLNITDELLLEEYINLLNQIGFKIENFGEHSYRVSKIPMVYRDQDISVVISNLLTELSENKQRLGNAEHLMLATLACKSAIKAGDYLNEAQREELIQALTEKHFVYTCPHGRPVKLTITLNELARMFKRA